MKKRVKETVVVDDKHLFDWQDKKSLPEEVVSQFKTPRNSASSSCSMVLELMNLSSSEEGLCLNALLCGIFRKFQIVASRDSIHAAVAYLVKTNRARRVGLGVYKKI